MALAAVRVTVIVILSTTKPRKSIFAGAGVRTSQGE